MALDIVIMAAGKGTRMKSRHPKVLHRLAGRSLLAHVLAATATLDEHHTWVITGHGADEVESAIAGSGAQCVRQMPQLGTGHAIQQVVPHLTDGGAAGGARRGSLGLGDATDGMDAGATPGIR